VKQIRLTMLALTFVVMLASNVYAQGAGIEWDILNQEALELRRVGKYDRAVVVAQKALGV